MYADKKCVLTVSKEERLTIKDLTGILFDKDCTGFDLSNDDIVSVFLAIAHEDSLVIDQSGEEICGLEIEYDD